MTSKFVGWAPVLAMVAVAAGCTSYRLGSSLPEGIESLYVPSLVNETAEPQLDAEVTRAVVREFQRDGTLRLASATEADARLEGTLVSFKLEPLRYERDEGRTAREYRLRIGANIRLIRADTDEVVVKRYVEGDATFDFFGDLASSKIQALPAASRDLAHDIVEAVVETW
jgi:hypothetical protein